jgi:hypothetical protein
MRSDLGCVSTKSTPKSTARRINPIASSRVVSPVASAVWTGSCRRLVELRRSVMVVGGIDSQGMLLQQSKVAGALDGRQAIVHAESAVGGAEVVADCAGAEEQLSGDLT